MNAWLTARRIKKGREEEFRKKWRGGETPEGMYDAYLLQDEDDPRETLSVSFWDTADQLLAFRTSEDQRKRRDQFSNLVEKDRWSRTFTGWNAWDLEPAGGKKKLGLLLPLLAAAGAGAYFFMKKRKGAQSDDEWETWESETAPVTATAAPASPTMTPPPVRPMDTQASARPMATQSSARPMTPSTTTSTMATRPLAGSAAGSGGSSSGGQRGAGGRTVADLMAREPETVTIETDAATAAQRMRTLDIGMLPVMADGRLAGVVTDRDIALGVSQGSRRPSQTPVGDLMTEAPHTISPQASIDEAADMMAEHQIRRLPVVEGTRLVGVLALADLAVEGAATQAGEALQEISEPSSPDR